MPTKQITEKIENAPVSGIDAVTQAESTISVDATTQTVAGSVYYFGWQQWFHTLTPLIDDVEAELGDDVYNRMLKDPKVFSQTMILVFKMINNDLSISPAVPEEDPQHAKAVEIVEFHRVSLKGLQKPFLATLQQMAMAIPYGNKVSELVYRYETDGPNKGKLIIDEINVKPRRSVAYVVDRFMHVIGLLSMVNPLGMYLPWIQIITDPASVPNLVPREKFFCLRFLAEDENPQGISWLRAVYTAWWRKLQDIGQWSQYCWQMAGGKMKGKLAPGARTYPDPITGQPVNPAMNMLSQLQLAGNGACIVIQDGEEVEQMGHPGGGADFKEKLEWEDSNISQGITFQQLATSESEHGTRAQASVHQDTMSLPVDFCRNILERSIEIDLFRKWTLYNFGPAFIHLTPVVSMADTPNEDRAALIQALSSADYKIAPEMLQDADAAAGFKPRPDEAVSRLLEQQENAQAALQDAGNQGQDNGDSEGEENEDNDS